MLTYLLAIVLAPQSGPASIQPAFEKIERSLSSNENCTIAPSTGGPFRILITKTETYSTGVAQSQDPRSSAAAMKREKVVFVDELCALSPPLKAKPVVQLFPTNYGSSNDSQILADLGEGQGFHWYARASYERIRDVRKALGLSGGEKPVTLAIRALKDGRSRNVPAAYQDLFTMKDSAVPVLEKSAQSAPAAIQVLANLGTRKSVAAIVRLNRDPHLRPRVQDAISNKKFGPEMKPVYESALREGNIVTEAAAAAERFGWREMLPALRSRYSHAQNLREALFLRHTIRKLESNRDLPGLGKSSDTYFGWSDHDTRALLASGDPEYASLTALWMGSIRTKGGAPRGALAKSILEKLRERGYGAVVDRTAKRFHAESEL